MKNTFKYLMAALSVLVLLAACTKEAPLSLYRQGITPSFAISSHNPAPNPIDSNRYVIYFAWNNPEKATDFSNVKVVTEIDFVGNNFANPFTSTVLGSFKDSVQAKVLNAWLLSRGIGFGQYANLQARMTASYSNNNDQKVSNTVNFQQRAYKIPPRVALPVSGRLHLVGSATQAGWDNPSVSNIKQEFARLDETTWAGVFKLNGGGEYLVLPLTGNWDNKYSVSSTTVPPPGGGDFGFNLPRNFSAPAADGDYVIVMDFQNGKFTVTPLDATLAFGVPAQLVVVGGASPGGWDNNASNTQRFTQLNSAEWSININLKADDGYLILPQPGSWDFKYGVPNRNLESARLAGPFKRDGQDFKSPTTAGNYNILMNFATMQYKLTRL